MTLRENFSQPSEAMVAGAEVTTPDDPQCPTIPSHLALPYIVRWGVLFSLYQIYTAHFSTFHKYM